MRAPKILSQNDPEFLDQPSRESNEASPTTSESTWSNDLPTDSVSPFLNSSFSKAQKLWTTLNSLGVPQTMTTHLLIPTLSLLPSMKQPEHQSNDTPLLGVQPWVVTFHPKVAKEITRPGLSDSAFRPTIGDLLERLKNDPKQFAKKNGDLSSARAAEAAFNDGVVWRGGFTLDEKRRTVKIISFGPHDRAYAQAKRRL